MKLPVIALAVVLTMAGTYPAKASSFVIEITQVGENVVATGSGTIDTNSLEFGGSGVSPSLGMIPSDAIINIGTAESVTDYYSATGPANFGTGNFTLASSGTGDFVSLNTAGGIVVPVSYVSGDELEATSTYE